MPLLRSESRILLARPDHLGDVLLTLPAVSALRRALPRAHIAYLVAAGADEIPRHCPNVDEIRVLPFPSPAAPPDPPGWSEIVARQADALRGRFDLALLLRPGDPWSGALLAAADVPVRLGYAHPQTLPFLTASLPVSRRRHAVAAVLDLAAAADRLGVPLAIDAEGPPPFCFVPTLRGGFSFLIKYGCASVGRVVEAGEAVTCVREGDLVFAQHPRQAEHVVPASLPVRLPPGIGPETGMFTANLETAVNMMLDAGLRLGERVLVFGQGVVGLLLTQLARRAGAGRVIAVDLLTIRREKARLVGADVALEPGKGLVQEVRRLTDGVGADLALEASGNGVALDQAIEAVASQGTVALEGASSRRL